MTNQFTLHGPWARILTKNKTKAIKTIYHKLVNHVIDKFDLERIALKGVMLGVVPSTLVLSQEMYDKCGDKIWAMLSGHPLKTVNYRTGVFMGGEINKNEKWTPIDLRKK